MDAGLSGVECEAPGRIASNVGGNRLKRAFLSQNSLFLANFFLFGLIKTDRLLAKTQDLYDVSIRTRRGDG